MSASSVVCSRLSTHISRLATQVELRATRWYEVLASHLASHPDDVGDVLSVCKRLWGQPLVAPLFALLLHRWLLADRADRIDGMDGMDGMDAPEVRPKQLNVMVSGCRQLFLGDVDAGSAAFEPLFRCVLDAVMAKHAIADDHHTHQLLGLCASFLPYYAADDGSFSEAFDRLEALDAPTAEADAEADALHRQFSAVDFAVDRAVDALSKDVRSDDATARYLRRLASLKDRVKRLRLSTRIRLQGAVYSLTQPGGPRYASKAVNRLAFRALDELFPHGKRTRRVINFGFRGLFVFSRLTGGAYYAYIRACLFVFGAFRALVGFARRVLYHYYFYS
jgi:hypothetical protein